MGGMILTVFGWLTAAVAVTALVAGAPAATHIASNGMRTVGITGGAMIGGVSDLVSGFNQARGTKGGGTLFTPQPKKKAPNAGNAPRKRTALGGH